MKKIIYIVIIVIGLGGAALMAYFALFGNSSSKQSAGSTTTTDLGSTTQAQLPDASILPLGNTLDFSKIQSFNKDYTFFPYPKVSPSEIGANNTASPSTGVR